MYHFLLLYNISTQTSQLKKAHHIISSQFYRAEVPTGHNLVLHSGSHNAKIKVSTRLLSHLEPMKKNRLPTSFRPQAQSHSLRLELRFQSPCWLLVGGYSQLPEALYIFGHVAPISLKQAMCLSPVTSLTPLSLMSRPRFKWFMCLGQVYTFLKSTMPYDIIQAWRGGTVLSSSQFTLTLKEEGLIQGLSHCR